ncbi:exodeoxyribonuclease V subunit beta [Alkalimarinus alittae]|uniref:RecBCD enzyme subunit RecB n=1 Tax=Alkalimarinus alittae TaxID=2961619 RepID=A0ABY6MXQ7_9ALTE|nr:exodeoxyribonuclease V subunit beta [Alkalimarinus alittae]UZE94618.1 exodeoxyribonuclease V subunit beta [Alkalimarinus alittae]
MSQDSVLTLDAHKIPLEGIHLIEASAGTGKTFNITRIYLRLLLERKLKVQNLLVVTFTKAATEELKGRIDSELRDTLAKWGKRDSADEFYQSLESIVSHEEANIILRTAIGDLDEASIFTIHGFCKRVLSQNAFESGLPFDLEMEVDSNALKLEAVRDWFRRLDETPEDYLDVTRYYSTPEAFTDTFRSLLGKELSIEGSNPEKVKQTFLTKKADACRLIEQHSGVIFAELIDSHKDKVKRQDEYSELMAWLTSTELDPMPKSAGSVFDGKRFSRKPDEVKTELNALFGPLKDLKQQAVKIADEIGRARADAIVTEALNAITLNIIERKKRSALMDFDDLVTSLLHALTGEVGDALAHHLVNQYPVALVDEFQDTDPSQYAIFNNIYNRAGLTSITPSALYMIGDPKQAIYGFRGGDVFAYLTARDHADSQWYMDTNWRSSSRVIEGYNRLFYGQAIPSGDDQASVEQTTHVFNYGIGYIPVKSSTKADESNLSTVFGKPLKYIYFPEDKNYGKGANNQQFRAVIADWCASEIKQLLTTKKTASGEVIEERDISVLVRDRIEAEEIQAALSNHGCSSVYLSNRENVFLSSEASELLSVLMGMLLAEDDRMLIAALSTRLCGFDSQQLYKLQEDELFWEYHRTRFVDSRASWVRKGLMATLFKLIHHSFKPELQRHERALTNTLHLLELLQTASQKHRQPWELVSWLRDKIENPASDSASELRLESDDNLIQIVTLHGSKGLEYPVVFIPFATRSKGGSNKPAYYTYHDETTKAPKVFVGADSDIQQIAERERAAEDVRLLYVAVTRAKYACYLGATPFSDYQRSPLGLMLGLNKDDDLLGAIMATVNDTPLSAEVVDVTETLDDDSERIDTTTALYDDALVNAKREDQQPVTVQRMTRNIEDDWWISSFSAITRNLKHGVMAEPDRDNTERSDVVEVKQKLDLRFTLKKGAAAGNLLHDTLEVVDFQKPLWTDALKKPLIRFGKLEDDQINALINWLDECLAAELSDGLSLSELALNKTLREVEFYFPIHATTRKALSGVLQHHRQTKTFPQLPEGVQLKGMMHGFIDLVFEWRGKYYIADYKSTYLGDEYGCYDHEHLSQNIQDNFYDLQYLIYCLALHRYLKQRIEDYTPETHFGGVYYLYLRGMGVNGQAGVYFSSIETELLNRLDELFGDNNA